MIEELRKRLSPYAPLFLRVGIGFVFLFFAYHKLSVPEQGRVEIQGILEFLDLGAIAALNYYLGVAELLIAASFFLGWKIRWFAPLAAVLVGTFFASITLKYGLTNDPSIYRDVGVLGGVIALWLLGAGPMSIDARKASATQKSQLPSSVGPGSVSP